MTCKYQPLRLTHQGTITKFDVSTKSGEFTTSDSGVSYPFTQAQVVRPDYTQGHLELRPTHYHPTPSSKAEADIVDGVVTKVLPWDPHFFDWCMQPYRLILRKGNEPREHPRFHTSSTSQPEYIQLWAGYNPNKNPRNAERKLYDMGLSAMYFEQFDPELGKWERVEDPR